MYSSWMKKYDEIVEKEDTKVSELDREELEATREVTTGKKIVNKLVDMAGSNEQRMVGGRTQGKTIESAMKLREEIFCTLEKDRTFKKFFVVSYLRNVYEQKELKLRKKDIKELIDAEMVEIIWR